MEDEVLTTEPVVAALLVAVLLAVVVASEWWVNEASTDERAEARDCSTALADAVLNVVGTKLQRVRTSRTSVGLLVG